MRHIADQLAAQTVGFLQSVELVLDLVGHLGAGVSQTVYLILPGMCFFHHADSFAIIRGGHIDITVLGVLEVSEKGDLANWMFPGRGVGNIGGGMDLAFNSKRVIGATEHTTKSGKPKIVKQCNLPLTAPRCVDLVITDIAVIKATEQGLLLKEVAPGWTVEEVQELTEPKLIVAEDLKEIEL